MGPNHGLGICFNATSIMLFILGEKIFIDVAGKNFIYNSIAQPQVYRTEYKNRYKGRE
jgi:hypothetical protein